MTNVKITVLTHVRHTGKHLKQWPTRRTLQHRAQNLPMLGLRTATMSYRHLFQRKNQILIDIANNKASGHTKLLHDLTALHNPTLTQDAIIAITLCWNIPLNLGLTQKGGMVDALRLSTLLMKHFC